MTSDYMKLSVVIPALNEEEIVGKTVRSVPLEKLTSLGFETEIPVIDAGPILYRMPMMAQPVYDKVEKAIKEIKANNPGK